MLDETIVGLIGLGYDEDGVSGFINPIMIDARYQGNHYGEAAMIIAHRKTNINAGKLYEKLGFKIVCEDEQDHFRTKIL